MININKVIIVGRITQKPILNEKGETRFVQFTIACNGFKNTDFIPCVAFGKTAESIAQYLDKGSLILIEGRVNVSSYEREKQNVRSISIVVTSFNFLERKGNSEEKIPKKPVESNDIMKEMMDSFDTKISDVVEDTQFAEDNNSNKSNEKTEEIWEL